MHIRNLQGIQIETIVSCLLESFSDYFVKMPSEVTYWETRFKGAGVDWESSFGMFDNDKLVAFIIHGIDVHQEKLSAFNTGTGVLPEYRSQKAVDQLYDFARSHFKQSRVERCMLEVIQENFRAIRVYERIGFSITRSLKCFQGRIKIEKQKFRLEKIPFEEVPVQHSLDKALYSWENSPATIKRSGAIYQTFLVRDYQDLEAGYFVINPEVGYVPKIEYTQGRAGVVFHALAEISADVRLNNIDESRKDLIANLLHYGLVNTVNQYEMEMSL